MKPRKDALRRACACVFSLISALSCVFGRVCCSTKCILPVGSIESSQGTSLQGWSPQGCVVPKWRPCCAQRYRDIYKSTCHAHLCLLCSVNMTMFSTKMLWVPNRKRLESECFPAIMVMLCMLCLAT